MAISKDSFGLVFIEFIQLLTQIITIITFVGLVVSFIVFGSSVDSQRTKVEYPQGTDIEKTNAIMTGIEERVSKIVNSSKYLDGDYNFLVESLNTQVSAESGNPQTDGGSTAEMAHRGKIVALIREYKYRKGTNSKVLKKAITEDLQGVYPGLFISIEKDPVGPPAGYPVNIELESKNYVELIHTSEKMRDFINKKSISGVAELKIDVNNVSSI
ncbi:hypothetical protein BTO06_00190 [Tenacibaculum sp. SZ-18]|nr:hypothetical protein BTO06_00190 [Tenacibaculum sp. SZ-18]